MRLHAVLLLGTSLLLAFPMSARAETCGEAFEALALEPTEPTLAAYSVLDVLLLAKDLDKPLPSPVTGEPFVADAWARATESASRELVDRLAACEWNGTLPRLDASTENLLFGRFGDLAPITLVGHPTGAGGTPDVLGVKGGFPAQQPLQFGASQLVAGGKPGIAATAVFVPFLATRGSTGPPGSLGIRRWLAHSGVTATVLLQFESDPPSGRVGSVEIGVGSTTASERALLIDLILPQYYTPKKKLSKRRSKKMRVNINDRLFIHYTMDNLS